MTITITNEEYEAIIFAISRIQSEVEGAWEETFINDAIHHQSALYSIRTKYEKALYKAREFQSVRSIVAEKNKGSHLMAREVDKLARKAYKYLKQKNLL